MIKEAIIQADSKDEERIIQSWRIAYPNIIKYKYPNRWRWLYTENPFWNSKEKKLPIWIAIVNEKVAAWNCAMSVQIELGQRPYNGAFSVSTYTLPEFRKRGLGFLVQKKNQDSWAVFLSVDMSKGNRRLKEKLGGKPGKPFDIYLKIITELNSKKIAESVEKVIGKYFNRAAPVFLRLIRLKWAISILGTILSTILKFRQARKIKNLLTGNYQFNQVSFFSSEVDDFWDKCRHEYSFAVSRDHKYLNWKYVYQPDLTYKKYLIKQKKAICGILIYRTCNPPEEPVGVICECLTFPSGDKELIKMMLNFAEDDMVKSGAHMIKCGTSSGALSKLLEKNGFQKIRTHVPIINFNNKMSSFDFKRIYDGNWLISLGDHDMDQFLKHEQPIFPDIVKVLLNKIPGREFV